MIVENSSQCPGCWKGAGVTPAWFSCVSRRVRVRLVSTHVAAGPTLCRGLASGRGLGCRWLAAGGPLSALPSDRLPTSRVPRKIRKSRALGSQEPILSCEWWGPLGVLARQVLSKIVSLPVWSQLRLRVVFKARTKGTG